MSTRTGGEKPKTLGRIVDRVVQTVTVRWAGVARGLSGATGASPTNVHASAATDTMAKSQPVPASTHGTHRTLGTLTLDGHECAGAEA